MPVVTISENFLDDNYEFPNRDMGPGYYAWVRNGGTALNGSVGYIKSTNKNISNSFSIIMIDLFVPGDATNASVSIDYAVASEHRFDEFALGLMSDEEPQYLISGDSATGVSIGTAVILLLPGANSLLLMYRKDDTNNIGLDEAQVSSITLTYTTPGGVDASIPIVSSLSVDNPTISDEPNQTRATITFQFDKAVTEYVARLNGSDHTTGILVHQGGAVAANTDAYAYVDWNESLSEGVNRINIYGKNSAGWTTQ